MSAEVAYLQMSAREAEVITEQIVGRLDQVSENIEAVQSLMRDALARRAHLALGYDSPGAYMRDRFEGALVNLSAALRREIVHELADAGMSTRAIAPIVGVDNATVHRDIARVAHATPEPVEVPAPDFAVNTSTGEIIDAPTVTEHTVTEKVKTVNGLDGKHYPKPEPKPKPVMEGDALADYDAKEAATRLVKALTALEGLTVTAHRDRIREIWWPRAVKNEEILPHEQDLFTPEPIRKIAQALTALANELEGLK